MLVLRCRDWSPAGETKNKMIASSFRSRSMKNTWTEGPWEDIGGRLSPWPISGEFGMPDLWRHCHQEEQEQRGKNEVSLAKRRTHSRWRQCRPFSCELSLYKKVWLVLIAVCVINVTASNKQPKRDMKTTNRTVLFLIFGWLCLTSARIYHFRDAITVEGKCTPQMFLKTVKIWIEENAVYKLPGIATVRKRTYRRLI